MSGMAAFGTTSPPRNWPKRQGVSAVHDVSELYGKGDPEDCEGFDEALEEWRRTS